MHAGRDYADVHGAVSVDGLRLHVLMRWIELSVISGQTCDLVRRPRTTARCQRVRPAHGGQITSIGSFTSVALTWASAYANDSLCTTQPNSTSVAIENIVVTAHSASAVTFSCFSIATGLAANCDDFTYTCAGR